MLTTKNKKSLSTYKQKNEQQNYLKPILLPDEILFEEIIMQMDTPDFMPLCKTNKKFYALCQDDKFWHKMFSKHFGTSEMKKLLPDMTWFELFKTCYGIYLIKKHGFFKDNTIKEIYTTTGITITGTDLFSVTYTLKLFKYMHNLQVIIIKVNDLTVLPIIPKELNSLPFLQKINFEKI